MQMNEALSEIRTRLGEEILRIRVVRSKLPCG